jgi:hypothetical protein
LVNPVTVAEVAPAVVANCPPEDVTRYPVTAMPPVLAGAAHETVACALFAVGLTPVGTPGGVTEVIVLPLNVIVPIDNARPFKAVPAPTDTAPFVRTEPEKSALAPNVTAPRTRQKTLPGCVPLVKLMLVLADVVSAASMLKMKTAFESPLPSKVNVPPLRVIAAAA